MSLGIVVVFTVRYRYDKDQYANAIEFTVLKRQEYNHSRPYNHQVYSTSDVADPKVIHFSIRFVSLLQAMSRLLLILRNLG